MTNAIDAHGNVVPAISNSLTEDNDLGFSARDTDAEEIAQGHYGRASTRIEDDQFNNNPSIVIRDGFRQHTNGEYQPGDLVMINGMEVEADLAKSMGLIKGDGLSHPSDDFMSDAENTRAELQEAQHDNRPESAKLLSNQIELAVGEAAPAVLDTFGKDIVENGEISESGLQFAQETLGMSEQSVQEIFSDMQDAGSQIMAEFMEVGDGLGEDRMAFLTDKAWNGTQKEQAVVRNLWFMAATGKLTRDDAAEAFDYLFKPYEG